MVLLPAPHGRLLDPFPPLLKRVVHLLDQSLWHPQCGDCGTTILPLAGLYIFRECVLVILTCPFCFIRSAEESLPEERGRRGQVIVVFKLSSIHHRAACLDRAKH